MLTLLAIRAAITHFFLSLYSRLAVFKILPASPMFSLGYGYYAYYLTR